MNRIVGEMFDFAQRVLIASRADITQGEYDGMHGMQRSNSSARGRDARRGFGLRGLRSRARCNEHESIEFEARGVFSRRLGRIKLKIALVHDRVRWEEKQLVRAAGELGIELELVNLENSFFKIGEEFDFDTALQRSISYYRAVHSTAILENSGVRVFESLETLQVCGNKLLASLKLQRAGVPIPKTGVGFSNEITEHIEYPSVVKPLIGSWGRLIAPLNDEESASSILEHREQLGALYNIHYVQERVGGKEIRTFVVGKEIVAAGYRNSREGEWRANVARGGKFEGCEVTPELEKMSLAAARAVNGNILSIDFFETETGLLVNEINGTPEFRGLSGATGVDIAGKIMEFAQ